MHTFIKRIIIDYISKTKKRYVNRTAQLTNYELAKGFYELRLTLLRYIKDIVLIGCGIVAAAFGLKSFLLQANFIDGGATGISLLLAEVFDYPLGVFLAIINMPFVLLGFHVISKEFAIKTGIAITCLVLCLLFINFPAVTNDKLLVSLFGGFFVGAGIGLSIRGGAAIDGTEVLAIYLSRKFRTTIGDIIIAINIIIFSVAAYLLSIEIALYSMVTYLSASKTLDFVIEGLEEYTGITIISSHSNEVREMIINILGRGVTIYNGKGGYGKSGETRNVDILYTVLTRLEINKFSAEMDKIDHNAFIVMHSLKDVKGGVIKKRALKH